MTAVGLWTIALASAYTLWLVVGGRIALRRRETGRGGFFVGGRTFSPWTVAFCITGLFSGSSFIAIVELSYRTGISAVWYGVAETVQVLLIALLLVKPLREKLVVTVTGIIGDRFGRAAKAISSVITGLTFPMYSVATTIAFASALHMVTGLTLPMSIAVTAAVLLAFLSSGGMHSVAFSQTMNVIMITLMFAVGVWALVGLTVVMVVFALLRSEQSAWWNVMAWTLRNGATFAPVLAAFFWPLATRSAALTALLAGFGSGLTWYTLSDFDPAAFFLGVHPVWVGMIANLVGLTAVTLVQRRWVTVPAGRRRQRGQLFLLLAAAVAVLSVFAWSWLAGHGLVGMALFIVVVALFAATVSLTVPAERGAESPSGTAKLAPSTAGEANEGGH
ncbi:sodium:solute symporter family transporter [Brevibacterium ihuae]|uniref:sodium:solute symporter family transporter n=1 Tax=Brevibacterium ihuae TaxID=1631743 RepID=UPI000C774F16|nr:hypothetical protein [Brevibacterium ihuae]